MKVSIFLLSAVAASAKASAPLQKCRSNWTIGQTVQTTSGRVNGHAAVNEPQVSEYLGIPFAKPPVGDLRFAAPVPYHGNATLNGTNFGYTCPAQVTTYNATLVQQSNVSVTVGLPSLQNVGTPLTAQSEDCLTLNVWTKPQHGDSKKAVLVWIYGGGFNSGSSSIPAMNAKHIVGQEDVIVVSINYRVNIFGFPGDPTSTANLGLLDQRLAVEWVRDNIENFGGDKSRITIFGQSAGSASVDFYNYAWVEDPIVAGFIAQSGTALSWDLPNKAESVAQAWWNVTEALGCGGASSRNATACMRTKSTTEIINAISATSGSGGVLGSFGPTVDETVVFSNYTERSLAGHFTKKPLLIGNNENEAGLFVATMSLQGLSYPDDAWKAFNLASFTCPSGYRANYSIQAHVPTWRYRYFGAFPNTEIVPNAGAWHSADIPILFDTNIANPPDTTAQIAIGKYMRGAWAAFAKDPKHGLTKYGWPRYEPAKKTLVRLAYNNQTGASLAKPSLYDAQCPPLSAASTGTSSGPTSSSASLTASKYGAASQGL
ncbi:hypothetical protein DSL72_000283 [Monilinia vaccinii-corymbosi]|uniref:Carboxylic ester hydrolase n=1 Tax=Monilinia vaccinii-corymbosi TaxID=61207 RepID=A0A8A3NYH7_9HELO|nr:hypothetical protein DSL72_000283 [Monilinia vaccinii-corymbosi]